MESTEPSAQRYMALMARGKEQRKTMTAVARELLGFIWAIGIKAEACLQATNGGMTITKEQKQELSK